MPEAVRWLERAAEASFAPAQFRLASLNEKGDGLKKDLQAARRFYLEAAGKGHAKAMHNLAVLYAEGIDGKPDYKAASEWFRKAASYGVTDSQYNLAILYARGIGIPINLAESYRWFALAAANGDSDAARKRDEVAARLDPKTLTMAKSAVQTFAPEREPDEATNLKAPPGGWDHTPAAPAKPRRQISGRTSQAPASSAPASIVR
jgi:localization factor PodJL